MIVLLGGLAWEEYREGSLTGTTGLDCYTDVQETMQVWMGVSLGSCVNLEGKLSSQLQVTPSFENMNQLAGQAVRSWRRNYIW